METINVLMSCYNGAQYVDEQIASILNQKTRRKIELYIRDDGSKDNTKEVLKKYEKYDNIHINIASNVGVVKSFIDLLNNPMVCRLDPNCQKQSLWSKTKK